MKAVEPACRRLIAKSKTTPRRNPPRTNKAVYAESYITRRVTRSMSRGDDGTGLGESIKEDSRGRRRVLRSVSLRSAETEEIVRQVVKPYKSYIL